MTGHQMQILIDRYNLCLDLEEGVVVASRYDGKLLKAATVAKMLGMKEAPTNWKETAGTVRGI